MPGASKSLRRVQAATVLVFLLAGGCSDDSHSITGEAGLSLTNCIDDTPQEIRVLDEDGTLISKASFDDPADVPSDLQEKVDLGADLFDRCHAPFRLTDVPAARFYQFRIENQTDEIVVSHDELIEMNWKINLEDF